MDSVVALDPGARYLKCGSAGTATPLSFRTDQVMQRWQASTWLAFLYADLASLCLDLQVGAASGSSSPVGAGVAACSRAGINVHGGGVMLVYNQASSLPR